MSQERFAGVVVGGPMAGQQMVHHQPTFRCETGKFKIGLRHVQPKGVVPAYPSFETTIYRHHVIAGQGIWTLEKDKPEQVMSRLLAVYMHATQKDRES